MFDKNLIFSQLPKNGKTGVVLAADKRGFRG
jgi:hypothetical protein